MDVSDLEDLLLEDFDTSDSTPPPNVTALPGSSLSVDDCRERVRSVLGAVVESFCFHTQAVSLLKDEGKLSEVSELLRSRLQGCVVRKSRVKGVNVEASQSAFYQLLTTGFKELTALTGDHRLSMWLCNSIFPDFYTPAKSEPDPSPSESITLSEAELDVVHYVGGFVCCKVKQRSKREEYKDIVDSFVSESKPEPQTLVSAKLRGRLLNINKDAPVMFERFEILFCTLFPVSVVNVSLEKYLEACLADSVAQDCFHNATDFRPSEFKDQVLMDMISLYFKVRIHQKCKNIVDNIRRKLKTSTKEKALRSKLAK